MEESIYLPHRKHPATQLRKEQRKILQQAKPMAFSQSLTSQKTSLFQQQHPFLFSYFFWKVVLSTSLLFFPVFKTSNCWEPLLPGKTSPTLKVKIKLFRPETLYYENNHIEYLHQFQETRIDQICRILWIW